MIVNAYATAAVSGVGSSFYLGGLAGRQDNGSIVNAYAVGAVSGSTDVGGLVGEQNGGSIANAYASGAVSGTLSLSDKNLLDNKSLSGVGHTHSTGMLYYLIPDPGLFWSP